MDSVLGPMTVGEWMLCGAYALVVLALALSDRGEER